MVIWACALASVRATASKPAYIARCFATTSSVAYRWNRSDSRRGDGQRTSNQRWGDSSAASSVAHESRNQKPVADGLRTRLPHRNAEQRSDRHQGQDQKRGHDQHSARPRDSAPPDSNNNRRGKGLLSRRNVDQPGFKPESAAQQALSPPNRKAQRAEKFARWRARGFDSSEDVDKRGGRGRESERSRDPAGAEDNVASSSKWGVDQALPDGGVLTVKQHAFLPSLISVAKLAPQIGKKMWVIHNVMADLGMTDTRPDLMLKFRDARRICAELDIAAIRDDDMAFDIHPRPSPSSAEEAASFPVRLPVVAVMGHVGHGKTTLLDKLRGTAVAKDEAGGTTEHITASSKPITGRVQDKGAKKGYRGIQKITLLDTPGHPTFAAVRSRGAMMADIVVLVVAADDGVMPETREVIWLVNCVNAHIENLGDLTRPPVQIIVALNKIDKPDADPERVKRDLLVAGVELEEMGGNVPCVHLSAHTGNGLADLEEAIVKLAELADLRAGRDCLPEGYVIDSTRDERWGNLATVLVKRGVLEKNSWLVAGTAWCKANHIAETSVTVRARPLAKALPGEPVVVAGWRTLPTAGDVFLGGTNSHACKKAVENRQRRQEQQGLVEDAERLNEAGRIEV